MKNKIKDPHYVVRVEKAISKKYGHETIQNPLNNWTDEKEEQYREHLQAIRQKEDAFIQKVEKVEVDGILVNKKLLSKEQNRICPVCESFSFSIQDDLYMTKFDCCKNCYIRWVEGREQRWIDGWRPSKGEN